MLASLQRDPFVKVASPLLMAAALLLHPPPVRAGEAACWVDQGVLVAPARIGDIAGDFILDTGEAHTLLHETRAQAAGIAETALAADISVAGQTLPRRPVLVADLDARTWALPTPIAGVIGADALAGLVFDIDWSPCKVTLSRRSKAPRRRATTTLRLRAHDGRLAAPAVAGDGFLAVQGDFVISTGSPAPVTLDERLVANLPTATDSQPMRLRVAAFAGRFAEDLPVAISRDGPGATLGAPLLMGRPLRFDLVRRRLSLLESAQQKGPPDHPGGP